MNAPAGCPVIAGLWITVTSVLAATLRFDDAIARAKRSWHRIPDNRPF